MYWRLKGNQGTMVTYAPICFRMVEIIWLFMAGWWVLTQSFWLKWN